MLDTNIVSDLVRNPRGVVFDRIAEVGGDAVCISIITADELRYGCANRGSAKLLYQVDAIMEGLDILPPDVTAATEYGGNRDELEAAGTPIRHKDLILKPPAYDTGDVLA